MIDLRIEAAELLMFTNPDNASVFSHLPEQNQAVFAKAHIDLLRAIIQQCDPAQLNRVLHPDTDAASVRVQLPAEVVETYCLVVDHLAQQSVLSPPAHGTRDAQTRYQWLQTVDRWAAKTSLTDSFDVPNQVDIVDSLE
jgi:hypothetical protein